MVNVTADSNATFFPFLGEWGVGGVGVGGGGGGVEDGDFGVLLTNS